MTRKVFESSGERLKVVGRVNVGIDNMDLTAATEHGCLVVNAPTAKWRLHPSMALHFWSLWLGMLLKLMRQ